MRARTGSIRRGAAILTGLALAGLPACATGGPGPQESPARVGSTGGEAPPEARGWTRRVTGLPVRDSAGSPYPYPFLGGLDVPRPQLLDIDGDGDQDLFLQERSGDVMFFERVESGADSEDTAASGPPAGGPPFRWRTDDYRDLEVGEWYRFGDVDLDGDVDLLAEEPFSLVRYYRNDGRPGEPDFVLAADTVRTAGGDPLFSDRQNVPNVGNVDCDDRQDLLAGRLDGTITRFEVSGREEGSGGGPVPRFRLVTERFQGIEIVAEIAGIRHGANSLVVTDFDGDGDPDLFWGDFFESGLLYIENTGSCARPNLRGRPVPFPPDDPLQTSGYNAPTFGDLDGDGDRDLLVGVIGGAYNPLTTSADNLYFLENTGSGWELRTKRYLPGLDVGSESVPAFADLDGDGDSELLLASKIDPDERSSSVIHRYENTGTPEAPSWEAAGSLPMRGSFRYAPTFGDLDDDGDPDLLMATWRDEIAFYRNRGTASGDPWPDFALEDEALVTLTRGSYAVPALGDVDGDGDLDLFVGESTGTLNFYRNDGSPSRPAFELVSDTFGGIDVGRRSAPALADLDGDGDLDLLVGSEREGIRYFRNRGSPRRPEFVEAGRLDAATRGLSAPVLLDVDGDGRLELFSGSAGGGLLYFERDGGP